MLIVTLKENEQGLIGNDISVMLVEIRGKQSAWGSRHRLASWFCWKSWR
jgi:hypothetical protein